MRVIIPIIALAGVFAAIAARNAISPGLRIWHVMLAGAAIVLLTAQISPQDALKSINPDVMIFLFFMFVIGRAMEQSGYLSHVAHRLFSSARSMDRLVLLTLLSFGSMSAFLMNDTLAIIGTPIMLMLAGRQRGQAKVLLLALAFSVTIGSAMSPIGNPQNLLIAVNGRISNPFVGFFVPLLVPTVINLFLAYAFLRAFYRKDFANSIQGLRKEPMKDARLVALCKASLAILACLVAAKVVAASLSILEGFSLTYIAALSALPILAFSHARASIVKSIDWSTLVFFASMFVLMASVWESGFFQSAISRVGMDITTVPMILAVSIGLSQLISNVPLAALYLPMLTAAGAQAKGMVALAAGSTIAGNLSVLGAASNVIIIQNAEKCGSQGISFLEFARIGIPLTIANALVYWVFLSLI